MTDKPTRTRNKRAIQELIQDLCMFGFLRPGFKPKPGQVIMSLSKEKRDLLRQAKSEDFNHRIT